MLAACGLPNLRSVLFSFPVGPEASDSMPHRSLLDQLLDRRDAIYDNLRDLRFEHRAGKFSEQDYEQMKQALELEAAQVLAEMDRTTGGAPPPATLQSITEKTRS